jgi:predicted PurR-regulated permease PerM
MLLAVILNPVVNAGARFRLPRVATVSILYVVLILGLTLGTMVLMRQFSDLGRALSGEPFLGDFDNNGLIELAEGTAGQDEFEDLNRNGVYDAGLLKQLEISINMRMAASRGGVLGDTLEEVRRQLGNVLADFGQPAGDMIADGIEQVANWAGGLVALVTLLLLIPFYLFFFLVEYPAISRLLRELVPERYREQTDRITKDMGTELASFIRGRLLVGLVKAVLLWIGLAWIGIQFALPIALVSGLLAFVPFLGPIVGGVPASIIALTMPGGGTETVLWVLGLFAAAEVIEGVALVPLLLGRETGLHPVTLVIVLLAGGTLMGTLGVIVAIPLALVCKVLWRELVLPLYREWANPPRAPDDGGKPQAPDGAQPAPAEG